MCSLLYVLDEIKVVELNFYMYLIVLMNNECGDNIVIIIRTYYMINFRSYLQHIVYENIFYSQPYHG